MNISKCPIWGTFAEGNSSHSKDGFDVISPRAGGKYFVSGSCERQLRSLAIDDKVSITFWLVEQRRMGIEWPEIYSTTLDSVLDSIPIRAVEKRNRVILWLNEKLPTIGSSIMLDLPHTLYPDLEQDSNVSSLWQLCAFAGCTSEKEAFTLVDFCENAGLVKVEEAPAIRSDLREVSLTFDGLLLVEELQTSLISSSQAFVAMWFGQKMNDAYELGFKPAIEDAGYMPVRIDRKDHNNKIDDEIIAEIRRSRFVVADFTSDVFQRKGPTDLEKIEAISRGGVYFEAGFAKGLGREVIWTARNDLIDLVHFDTRQFNHITWATPEELRDKLSKRISATLGDGPLRKSK